MIGSWLVKLAFGACLCSTGCYIYAIRRGDDRLRMLGRRLYQLTIAAVLGIAAILLHLILTHQFQYTYVWSYSSRSLPTPLLVSTFYAGQEGSFTLWTLFTVIIGAFLVRDSARKGYEAEVMAVYGGVTISLLLFLLVKSPFQYVWETWPAEVPAGFLPADGRGLNPLLQNYWMVIHPQVLFSGFAAMGVPYAYALAGVLKRDYTSWIRPATPWLVLGALVLGTGIIMGGFWAYETLGWGGYWGWDPVENSSLVPWIVCVAALHSMLIQRKTGRFIRTNIVLSILCFLMVLYSTFLTRSGVLGETSVHSFVDPGMWVYWLLVGTIIAFASVGALLLGRRWKEIPRPKSEQSLYSREFAIFLGSSALVAAALLITVGNSAPLITGVLNGTKSAVDRSYFVDTSLPLGVLIALLSGIGQLLWWTKTGRKDLLRLLLWPAGLSVLSATAFSLLAWSGVLISVFILASTFALFANLQVAWRIWKGNPAYAGGAAAHVGVAIMFLGFVASSKYDQTEQAMLVRDRPTSILGYTLTYQGYRQFDGEKYAFRVAVEQGDKRVLMQPVMYQSSYTEGVIRNPDIANLFTHDFYLAPLALENGDSLTSAGSQQLSLSRGKSSRLGEIELLFLGLNRPVFSFAGRTSQEARDTEARFLVRRGSGKAHLVAFRYPVGAEQTPQPAVVDQGVSLSLFALRHEPGGGEAALVDVQDLQAPKQGGSPGTPEVLLVEATIKPYINLVWSGVIILLTGLMVTIVRRAREAIYRTLPAP